MSLDVYLTGATKQEPCRCLECDHEHTRNVTERFYSDNITHNLGEMAHEAGIYEALWRPEEIGVTKAGQLIPLLRDGLSKLLNDPKHYEQFNAKNGWGLYEHFVPFVSNYLNACEDNPNADVSVFR